MKNHLKVLTISILAVLLTYGSAIALTTINPSGGGNGSELNLDTILATRYPGGNLTRIDDAVDQIWKLCNPQNPATGTVIAKIASSVQQLGWAPTTGNPPPVTAITPPVSADIIPISQTLPPALALDPFTPSVPFVFSNNQWFSKDSLNSPNEDHMVTWKVNSTNTDQVDGEGECVYVIAWEDTPIGSGDFDYNDLVVEVRNVEPGDDVPIPEPATMFLLGSGLFGMGVFVRRRFKK